MTIKNNNCQRQWILGPLVETFEKEFAKYVGAEYCIGVANGTDAIRLALQAQGVGPGDKVATVSWTFVGTVLPILQLGAIPVLIDIDEDTFTMDPRDLAYAFEKYKDIKAVLPVSIFGHAVDLDKIREICDIKKIPMIQDNAQAHGTLYKGNKLGMYSTCTYSFYPTKNLGGAGDGGCITTNDKKLYEKLRALRNYGTYEDKYDCEELGWNSRLDEIQAEILLAKLPQLDTWNFYRQKYVEEYEKRIKSVSFPKVKDYSTHTYHQCCIKSNLRDKIAERFDKEDIQYRLFFKKPIHKQKFWKKLNLPEVNLPITEKLSKQTICIPIHEGMIVKDLNKVIKTINEVINETKNKKNT